MDTTKLQIAIGTDDFKEMLSTSDVFVDKTLFIKDIIDSREKAILITRPRRWGKTLNLDMLLKFLAIEVDDKGERVEINSNRVFFEGGTINIKRNKTKDLASLKIAEIGGEYMEDQGDYPVIFINLKDVRALTYNEVVIELKNLIKHTYKNYKYLIHSDAIDNDDKQQFQIYIDRDYTDITTLKDSIRFLSELLYKHHKKKVYILVDEYDKPVNYFLEQGLDYATEDRKQTAALITGIMSACGKSNPYLEKIVLTGIFDAFAKEGGSGFNNVKIYGIGDKRYSQRFGFSGAEVKEKIEELAFKDQSDVMSTITEWYNGYRVQVGSSQTIELYTPWSVMNYLASLYIDDINVPQSYWNKSGVNWILNKIFIDNALINTLKEMCYAKNGTEFDILSSDLLEYIDQGNNKSLVGYLLFHSGYITLGSDGLYKLPNTEVSESFKKIILNKWLSRELGAEYKDSLLEAMHDSLHNHEQFSKVVQEHLLDKMDGEGRKTEAYFHGLIGGCMEWYRLHHPQTSKFLLFSEKSVKGGRMDHIFFPIHHNSDQDNVVIIHEYGKLDKIQEDKVDSLLKAKLQQIVDKKYMTDPLARREINSEHTWHAIKIRSILFVCDELKNKWSIKTDEIEIGLEDAKKLIEEQKPKKPVSHKQIKKDGEVSRELAQKTSSKGRYGGRGIA